MGTIRESLAVSETDRTTILIDQAKRTRAVLLLAHGAGAGMEHSFFTTLVPLLTARGITVVRMNFLYMEKGSKRPDRKDACVRTIAAAAAVSRGRFPGLPFFIGGKSMGGRMASHYLAEQDHPDVRGLVFLGFPLHPPKKPGTQRAAHLSEVTEPMLFLQGTRDALADLTLLTPLVEELPRAEMEIIDTADHSFAVLKRAGLTVTDVMNLLADRIAKFVDDNAGS
jgi:hypothetical protein